MRDGSYRHRSDTVTKPTEEMRQANVQGGSGEMTYTATTTVNRLEELVAREMGKRGGLFVASGTWQTRLRL